MTKKEVQKVSVLTMLECANGRLTAGDLADQIGIPESADSCPNTRGIIRDLIDDGYPIGSNARGYKLLTSGKDVQAYLNNLLQRQMAISRRIQAIYDGAKLGGLL